MHASRESCDGKAPVQRQAPRLSRTGNAASARLSRRGRRAVVQQAPRLLARSEELDRPLVALIAVDAVLGLVLYAGPGALDPRHFQARVAAVVRPGLLALVIQAVVGCLLFPWSHPDGDPDYSWFAVVPMITLLLGTLALLLAVLAWGVVVAPVAVLVLRLPAAVRGDPAARQAVLVAVVLLAVIALSVSVSLVDADGGRANIVELVGLLLGWERTVEGSGGLLWVARAATAVIAVALVLLVRVRRAMTAAGVDPDADVPIAGR